MSTGQRQRVKLAQAIAADPRLIVLDEPTDGLDPVQRDEMLNIIVQVNRNFGIDVMLSSHVLEEVERVCDHVVALAEGKLVAQGSMIELAGASGGIELELVEIPDRPRSVDDVAARLVAGGAGVRRNGNSLSVVGLTDDELFDLAARSVSRGRSAAATSRPAPPQPRRHLRRRRHRLDSLVHDHDRTRPRRRADRRARVPALRGSPFRGPRRDPQRQLGEHPGHARPRSTGPQQDLPGDLDRDRLPAGGGLHRHRRADPVRHPRARGGRRLPRLLRLHHPRHRAVHRPRRARGAGVRSPQRDAGDVPVDTRSTGAPTSSPRPLRSRRCSAWSRCCRRY